MLIFTIVMFILAPVYSIPFSLIGLFGEKRIENKKIFAAIFSISASLILYDMKPNEAMDLYRYYGLMNTYSNLSINQFFDTVFTGIEPLMNLIFFTVSKLSNHNLLVYFVGLFSYYIQFYIIFDYQKVKNIKNKELNIIIFYFIATFLLVYHVTGIRLCLGRMIFLLAMYRDFYKNDKSILNKILYIIPIFIHQSIIIMLILRIIMKINKNKFDVKIILLFVFAAFSPKLLIDLTSYLSSNFTFLSRLTTRAEYYLGNGNTVANIYKLQFVFMIYLYFIIIYMKLRKIESNKKIISYTLMTLSIGLAFSYSSSISTRYISTACSFSPLIFIDMYSSISNRNKLLFTLTIFAFSIFYIAFQLIQLKAGTYGKIYFINTDISVIAMVSICIFMLIKLLKTKIK